VLSVELLLIILFCVCVLTGVELDCGCGSTGVVSIEDIGNQVASLIPCTGFHHKSVVLCGCTGCGAGFVVGGGVGVDPVVDSEEGGVGTVSEAVSGVVSGVVSGCGAGCGAGCGCGA